MKPIQFGKNTRKIKLFTIGHSTHPIDQFVDLLNQHRIKILADIRRFPGSRKFPQFNRENLANALNDAGIEHHWLEALGGRRKKETAAASDNSGLRNQSFRNYADYMQTAGFQMAVGQLLGIARRKRVAFMCAEGLYWQCHRRLVSDFLLAQGIAVEHIMPSGELRPHSLTSGARIESGKLSYPPPETEEAR